MASKKGKFPDVINCQARYLWTVWKAVSDNFFPASKALDLSEIMAIKIKMQWLSANLVLEKKKKTRWRNGLMDLCVPLNTSTWA